MEPRWLDTGGTTRNFWPMSLSRHAGLMLLLPALCAAALAEEQKAVSFHDLNTALGIELFDGTALWEQSAADTAKRLGWPQESETSDSASYRLYPRRPISILGARPFSIALYAENDRVQSLSLVFANKGDVDALIEIEPGLSEARIQREVQRMYGGEYKRFIRQDASTIESALTEVLGPPATARHGETSTMRERVLRWDWNDHSFLLAAPREEYVALRVLPTEDADARGIERVSNTEMRERLAARVEERPNGDVILTDMPMVDQGPKGYCVPATWERVLRYMGIPADMYVLAMTGGTQVGGGTSTRAIAAAADELVRRHGRRHSRERGRVDLRFVSRYIDQGLPIIWAMQVVEPLNTDLVLRTRHRNETSDWEAWKEKLDPLRREARRLRPGREGHHVCMIVGYNRETGEIAISDSWGPQFAERWITIEEAEAISQSDFTIINI